MNVLNFQHDIMFMKNKVTCFG